MCCALLASGTSAISAQGLGNIINKGKAVVKKGEKAVEEGKKAVGTIFGTGENSSENASSPESSSANQAKASVGKSISSSGIVISNPVSSFIEIEPIGLYGVSKSENYGDAYLVLKVKKLIPKDVTGFGSSIQNQKMVAVDNNGKVYNIDASGHYQRDTPEGIMVRVILDEPGLMFTDIKKDVNRMQQVKFGVFSDAQHQGNVTLNNVPIFWEEIPE